MRRNVIARRTAVAGIEAAPVAIPVSALGPRIILPESALGVVGPTVLGVWTLLRSQSAGGVLFGAYLIALGVNYAPLLFHAIDIVRRGTTRAEIAAEPGDRQRLFQKYRRQSLWLLVSFVVVIVALKQGRPAAVTRT
jgi:hypothetical protein